MLKTARPSGMTIDQLAATIPFVGLAPRQQVWVREYIGHFLATGLLDARRATEMVYHCKSKIAYRRRQYRILNSRPIQAALKVYWDFGVTERDCAIVELDHQIAAARPGSTAAAQLLAQRNNLKFGTPGFSGKKGAGLSNVPPPDAPRTPRFTIGEVVVQDGVSYEITGLDADGNPITRELV